MPAVGDASSPEKSGGEVQHGSGGAAESKSIRYFAGLNATSFRRFSSASMSLPS
jgi:hypothetical protein